MFGWRDCGFACCGCACFLSLGCSLFWIACCYVSGFICGLFVFGVL